MTLSLNTPKGEPGFHAPLSCCGDHSKANSHRGMPGHVAGGINPQPSRNPTHSTFSVATPNSSSTFPLSR